MIQRQQFLDALLHECDVCKHLHGKLSEAALDYRPTPGQRSTLELLRYLAICGIASIRVIDAGGDWSQWKSYGERSAAMSPEEFPAMMDLQMTEIRERFESYTDDELLTKETIHPTGEKMPLGIALMRMTYAWLVAYRMQLFLYAKAAGAGQLTTANCWSGIDWPTEEVEKAEEETVAAES